MDIDHHARGRELRDVSTSPENKTRYRTIFSLYVNIKKIMRSYTLFITTTVYP